MKISAFNILLILFVAISSHAQTMELDFLKVAHGGILQKYIENEYPVPNRVIFSIPKQKVKKLALL
tara:strand:- start:430 stop:627 length:198 start_codon:yes stop_codon:yes gene_type:complete